jgi:hypothetical protein
VNQPTDVVKKYGEQRHQHVELEDQVAYVKTLEFSSRAPRSRRPERATGVVEGSETVKRRDDCHWCPSSWSRPTGESARTTLLPPVEDASS